MTDYPEAWFSTLGAALGDGEQADIAAYLHGLGIRTALPTLLIGSWSQASALAHKPADAWWDAEEAERARLEKIAMLDPADHGWLSSTDALLGAAACTATGSRFTERDLLNTAGSRRPHRRPGLNQYRTPT